MSQGSDALTEAAATVTLAPEQEPGAVAQEESAAAPLSSTAALNPASPAVPALQPGQPQVQVRLRIAGQTATVACPHLALARGSQVVVETPNGPAVATVLRGRTPTLAPHSNTAAADAAEASSTTPAVRLITEQDERLMARHGGLEKEALAYARQRASALSLPMKLISVEFSHNAARTLFFFTSAERVDFRALVKDLARRFHTRIEMRQIGVRDAARHTGGVALCGRALCCATWLPEFKPISIRMAKDQNLSLNHQKLSGVCGRLRCCLEYEQEAYQQKRKNLPKLGKLVLTPQGEGRVKDVNVLNQTVRVELREGGYAEFAAAQISRPEPQAPQPAPSTTSETSAAKARSRAPESSSVPATTRRSSAPAATPMGTAGETAGQSGAEPTRRRRRRPRRRKKSDLPGGPGTPGAVPDSGTPRPRG